MEKKSELQRNKPLEKNFGITEPFAYMQRGLSAYSDYSDYIYVVDSETLSNLRTRSEFDRLKSGIFQIVSKSIEDKFPQEGQETRKKVDKITKDHVIVAFQNQLWNTISDSSVDKFNLFCNETSLPQLKRNYYKFNLKIFFEVKKLKKDEGIGKFRKRNKITQQIIDMLKKLGLTYYVIEGEARQFCGVKNSVLAGRFNDNIEKPKDPYSFFLNCLIGYENSEHLGGSYLLAQKCKFKWKQIHNDMQKFPKIIGRNTIKQDSSIFSQGHCPFSHIRSSRIKDEDGNPVVLYRQSKSFTTQDFNEAETQTYHDYLPPEEGIFFLGFHRCPNMIQKMLLNQLGTKNDRFDDQLLQYLDFTDGNILYVPNSLELISLQPKKKNKNLDLERLSNCKMKKLCEYHETRWLKNYKRNQDDEDYAEKNGNPYYLYSRAGFMAKMSDALNMDSSILHPPSPRVLRILSKTFALWQDTWYFDRKQIEIPHLQYFISNNAKDLEALSQITGYKFDLIQNPAQYENVSKMIRNGLAIYFNLSHVVSTKQYGCRGPIDGDPSKPFGANTFHLEPEDILVGGEANLTFGQGKHLIEYLTENQMKQLWSSGKNLSAHSGIGHINPNFEEIIQHGLQYIIDRFQEKANKFLQLFLNAKKLQETEQNASKKKKLEKHVKEYHQKYQLFISSVFALLGMQKYFDNYEKLATKLKKKLKKETQIESYNSLRNIQRNMRILKEKRAENLCQGAQMVLSVFICLHLTGEPVSLGRLDHVLDKFVKQHKMTAQNHQPSQEEQDIIDMFWIKVGEKANFNKNFFEDHQKWGNLAMGGDSSPYPQGASFNQWGQQLTVGGSTYINQNQEDKPFYNSVTISCLRAARRIPVNAPCLGLRLHKNTPEFIINEASKTILSGGAHPICLNDQKIIAGFRKSGNYIISRERWEKTKIQIDGEPVQVPYQHWKTQIQEDDLRNFGSDGCYQFLPIGKSWFWLAGGNILQPLQYVINVGKNLLFSGPQFIHGQRQTYRWRDLNTYENYDQFQKEYFDVFEQIMRKRFLGQLSGFQNLSQICPATLLNAFTTDMIHRESDFYINGTNYKLFCPQYTGAANLVNSLWNIRQLVFLKKQTTLQEVRDSLLVNWGQQMEEPFISRTLPQLQKDELKRKIIDLRKASWDQRKFGIDREVTVFGYRILQNLSHLTRKIFQQPQTKMLTLFKTLTAKYGSKSSPFGFQYLPGCGTFENFADVGAAIGASFDGRKKGQPVAQDLSPQNLLLDIDVRDSNFQWKDAYLEDVLKCYTYKPNQSKTVKLSQRKNDPNDPEKKIEAQSEDIIQPEFYSGAVLDLNIDEDYDQQTLAYNLKQFAEGQGPNLITITVARRQLMQQLRKKTDRDLLRFRQGGWSEFGISVFPHLLQHHIRRKRELPKAV